MHEDIFSYEKIKVDRSFLDRIWEFSPNNLDSLTTETLSKYSLGLAQFLIFFKAEQNKTRAVLAQKKRLLESSIAMSITPKVVRENKTKAAQVEFVTQTSPELTQLSDEIEEIQLELIKVDSIDKVISEYIATFKKEIGRRENEMFSMRAERN